MVWFYCVSIQLIKQQEQHMQLNFIIWQWSRQVYLGTK